MYCLSSSSSPDGPYLRVYLKQMSHANTDNKTKEVDGDLVPNISSKSMKVHGEPEANISSLEVNWEIISNVSTKVMDMKGVSSANVNGSSTVEVYEGQDVMLTFVTESYPQIRNQRWTTPTHINNNNTTVYRESYTANGYRLACYKLQDSIMRVLL